MRRGSGGDEWGDHRWLELGHVGVVRAELLTEGLLCAESVCTQKACRYCECCEGV